MDSYEKKHPRDTFHARVAQERNVAAMQHYRMAGMWPFSRNVLLFAILEVTLAR